jgi:hypothetical protein
MFFGQGSHDPATVVEGRTWLAQFQGVTSISSNQYFERDKEETHSQGSDGSLLGDGSLSGLETFQQPLLCQLKISRADMKLSPITIRCVDSSGNTSTTSTTSSTTYAVPAPLFQPPNYSLPSPKSLSSDTGATTKAASPMTPTQVESLLEIISSVEAEAPIREQAGSENAREEEGGPQITRSSPLPEPSSIAILTSLFGWSLAPPALTSLTSTIASPSGSCASSIVPQETLTAQLAIPQTPRRLSGIGSPSQIKTPHRVMLSDIPIPGSLGVA